MRPEAPRAWKTKHNRLYYQVYAIIGNYRLWCSRGVLYTTVQLFHNRPQRVKIGNSLSLWENVSNGAAQGSLMGPFCYNVLCIDLFDLIFNYVLMLMIIFDENILINLILLSLGMIITVWS